MNTLLSFELPKCDYANIYVFSTQSPWKHVWRSPNKSFEDFLNGSTMQPARFFHSNSSDPLWKYNDFPFHCILECSLHGCNYNWLLKTFWPVIVVGSQLIGKEKKHAATCRVDWRVGFIYLPKKKHTQNTKWSISIVNAWGRTVAGRTNSEGVAFSMMRKGSFPASSSNNKYKFIDSQLRINKKRIVHDMLWLW